VNGRGEDEAFAGVGFEELGGEVFEDGGEFFFVGEVLGFAVLGSVVVEFVCGDFSGSEFAPFDHAEVMTTDGVTHVLCTVHAAVVLVEGGLVDGFFAAF